MTNEQIFFARKKRKKPSRHAPELASQQIERERRQWHRKILFRLARRRNKLHNEQRALIQNTYATPDFQKLGRFASAMNKAKNWVRQRIG